MTEPAEGAETPIASRLGVPSAELFRLLVDSVREYAIFVLDPKGTVATWNAGAQRIKGYRADEIIGKHFSVFYPEEDVRAGKCEHELLEAARVGRFEDEGWRLRADGSRFWANVVISAMRDERGVLLGFSKVTRDLTERKRAEEEQKRRLAAEERFRLIVSSVRDYAIFMLDAEGRIATWNPGAERINGYRLNEIVGRHFSVFYPEEDVRAGKCERELREAVRDGRFEDEGWRLRKDGSRFWANVVITPVRDDHGALIGFSKVTRDLADRLLVREEQAARIAAEQANRAKDTIMALLGHELRNPLAPIVTALQIMKLRDPHPPKEHQVIERQVRHMVQLVDDLLDVSRISEGKIQLSKKPVDLRDALARAIEMVSPLVDQRGHELSVDVPPGPVLVDADDGRLTQIFTNILNNAAKYTEKSGHIDLEVRRSPGQVVVAVRDDGAGIEPELLPRVFEQFVQGEESRARSHGGLGLGLALVRSLVELHGGRVEAQSDGAGKGSTFTVWLPEGEPRGERLAASSAPTGTSRVAEPRRVLLIDDNHDARLLLAEGLAAVGHEVQSFADGPAALAAARSFAPEVAILDIGLPGMSGYELAELLAQELAPARPRLIALTGYGQSEDRQRSEHAGFAAHFVKPVELRELLELIAR